MFKRVAKFFKETVSSQQISSEDSLIDFQMSGDEQKASFLSQFHDGLGKAEHQSALLKLKSYVQTLDSDSEDFEQVLDKLIFGFALFDHCRFYDDYPAPLKRVGEVSKIKEFNSQDDYIQFLLDVGEHVLIKKSLPITEDIIKRRVSDENFLQYLLNRLQAYEPLSFEAYEPTAIKKELIYLSPTIAKDLFKDIELDSQEFDYMTMGLVVTLLSKKNSYPLTISQLCQELALEFPSDSKSYEHFYMKIGKAILDDKNLPHYESRSIYEDDMATIAKDYIVARHESYDTLSLSQYNAKEVIVELDSMLSIDYQGVLDDIGLDDVNYDYCVAGLLIYALAINDDYPITGDALDQLIDCHKQRDKIETKQIFLSLGKLALDEQQIPLVKSGFDLQDEMPRALSKFSARFLENRLKQHDFVSITAYRAIEVLNSLLPEGANSILKVQDFIHINSYKLTQNQHRLIGALIFCLVNIGEYPIALQSLLSLSGVEKLDLPSDYSNFFEQLAHLALDKKQIPIDSYNIEKKLPSLDEPMQKWIANSIPIDSTLSFYKYDTIEEIHEILPELGDSDYHILPIWNAHFSEFCLGFLIYSSAFEDFYPLSLDELYKACDLEAPTLATYFEQFLLKLGKLAIRDNSIPFSLTFLQDNKDKFSRFMSDSLFHRLEIQAKYARTMTLADYRLQRKLQEPIESMLGLPLGLISCRINTHEKYLCGLLIYQLALKECYPINCEQLKMLCQEKPKARILGFFKSNSKSVKPKTANDYNQLFIKLGYLALFKNSIPFEQDSIEQLDGLTDDSKALLKQLMSRDYRWGNTLSYNEYAKIEDKSERGSSLVLS
jgi:hypothetical protein